jgi:hypothetical protein
MAALTLSLDYRHYHISDVHGNQFLMSKLHLIHRAEPGCHADIPVVPVWVTLALPWEPSEPTDLCVGPALRVSDFTGSLGAHASVFFSEMLSRKS